MRAPLTRPASKCGSARFGGFAALGLVVVIPWLGAAAQYPVYQDGRLLDRNPELGGAGYNYGRPLSPLIPGNVLATGNVGRGFALRSFSPISSPTAFRASLGSGSLGDFVRDSVSIADAASHYSALAPRLYYDPARTAPTAGYLQGQYTAPLSGVGAFAPRSYAAGRVSGTTGTGPLDLRLEARAGTAEALRAGILGLPPAGRGELSSTLFGLPSQLPPSPYAEHEARMNVPLAGVRPLDMRPSDIGPLEQVPAIPRRTVAETPATDNRLDLVLRTEPLSTLLDSGLDVGSPPLEQLLAPGSTILGAAPPQPTQAAPPLEPEPVQVALTDPSVLPGYDTFNDMQLALALSADPNAEWFRDMKEAIKENPRLAPELQDLAAVESEQFVRTLLDSPLQTFVGRGASAVNNELLKAESLLDLGHYYEAATRYEVAHVLDPTNPLPLLGKGHALLAAGDYLSAALYLVRGIERFPELVRFKVNLQSLVGGGEIVDIRRADLMRRLENSENPRLRFLLGYLEYHGGNRESGLKNLEQAASDPAADNIIRLYPAMLKGEGQMPPPKLPTDLPSRPESGVGPGRGPAPEPAGPPAEPSAEGETQ